MDPISCNLFIEMIVRVILWALFIYFDVADPFIREIQPSEVWLYQYPTTPSYIPSRILWLIIVVYPTVIALLEYWLTKSTEGPVTLLKSITFAYPLNGMITSIFKNVVGRPRPDFVSRCFPSGGGTDFRQCTGLRKDFIDGRKSFPSGHASFAFTCMVFMCLYQAKRLDFSTVKAGKACLCIFPLMIAGLIAASRTCDYHHHYQDVIAGAMLGTSIAYLTYHLYVKTSNTKPCGRIPQKS